MKEQSTKAEELLGQLDRCTNTVRVIHGLVIRMSPNSVTVVSKPAAAFKN